MSGGVQFVGHHIFINDTLYFVSQSNICYLADDNTVKFLRYIGQFKICLGLCFKMAQDNLINIKFW